MKTKDIELKIDVSGTIHQYIKLKPQFEMEQSEFKKMVKEGKILTSIGHGENNGKVYLLDLLDNFVEIGTVIVQDACDDLEISVV